MVNLTWCHPRGSMPAGNGDGLSASRGPPQRLAALLVWKPGESRDLAGHTWSESDLLMLVPGNVERKMLFSTEVPGATTKNGQPDTAREASSLEMLDRNNNTSVCTHVYTDGSSDAAVRHGRREINIRYSNRKDVRGRWLRVRSNNSRSEITASHEAARLLSTETSPLSHIVFLSDCRSAVQSYSHLESSWEKTHTAFFVTCHNTARSLSSGSMLTVGTQETRRGRGGGRLTKFGSEQEQPNLLWRGQSSDEAVC